MYTAAVSVHQMTSVWRSPGGRSASPVSSASAAAWLAAQRMRGGGLKAASAACFGMGSAGSAMPLYMRATKMSRDVARACQLGFG